MRPTTLAEMEAFLARAVRQPLPGPATQRRFAPIPPLAEWAPDLRPSRARRAGTLLLVYPAAAGLAIPLTVRHGSLPHHGGQVSLPGGAVHEDERPEAAALREAHEEIGIAPDRVRIVGALSTVWIAVSNFVAFPFVAVTDEAPAFRPHRGEVEELLEVPVADVCDRGRLRWTTRTRNAAPTQVPYLAVGAHVVWGATAMILGEFAALFDDTHGPDPPDAA